MDALQTAQLAGNAATTAHEITILGLFWQADAVVKIVMMMLVVASIWCWAIIIEKLMRIRRLNAQADSFEEAFWSGGSLDALYDRIGQTPACANGATPPTAASPVP